MANDNPFLALSAWYAAQCDGSWEHQHGIEIETLDNPGWSLKVDLADTKLCDIAFETIEHRSDGDVSWWRCWREGNEFRAACGPLDLSSAMKIFIAWANSAGV